MHINFDEKISVRGVRTSLSVCIKCAFEQGKF